MPELHALLMYQLQQCFPDMEDIDKHCRALIEQVNETYKQFDHERNLLKALVPNVKKVFTENEIESNAAAGQFDEQIVQAKKMESVSTLAGGIAHDFNNILGIILAYLTYMQSEGYDPTKSQENVAAVESAIKRGSLLVEQLRLFAKQTKRSLKPVNFDFLLNELVAKLKTTFSRGIDFSVETEKNLPQLLADQSQLSQALFNLCVNARDAMPGGGLIVISVDSVLGANLQTHFHGASKKFYIHIQVTDTGTGMDEQTADRIFEPFFSTKGKEKGVGLGLSVVYGIIQSHEGFVSVESEIGKGTTFHLYLPAEESNLRLAQQTQPEKIVGGTETLLVIEDEKLLLSFLKSMLEREGYHVLTAEDGQEALNVYSAHKDEIGLVLTDVGIPKLNGIEAMQKIREQNSTTSIIFASGNVDGEMFDKINRIVNSTLIQKPYDPREVLVKIRETLDCVK